MITLDLNHCVWTDLPGSDKGAAIRVVEGDVEYRVPSSSEPVHIPHGPQKTINEGPLEVHSLAHKSVIHYRTLE
jgi:hypothetical protein